MLLLLSGVTSCLKDNTTEAVLVDDTAITAFSLLKVNHYEHKTTTSGKDTVVKSILVNSDYPFTIDQYQRKIYNTDSLPAGSDVKHILITATSKNNTNMYIEEGDGIRPYSNADSIDFSSARTFRVYDNLLQSYRSYEVKVNMKSKDYQTILWTRMPEGTVPPVDFGLETIVNDITDSGFKLSRDGGKSWTDENLHDGEDPMLLPISNIAYIEFQLANNDSIDYHLMVGNAVEDAKACTVWRKMKDKTPLHMLGSWVRMPIESNNIYYLPADKQYSLFDWDDAVVAMSTEGKFYYSSDKGITWKPYSVFKLPDNLTVGKLHVAKAKGGLLWLVSEESNEVWQGKLVYY